MVSIVIRPAPQLPPDVEMIPPEPPNWWQRLWRWIRERFGA